MPDIHETPAVPPKFDFSSFPEDTLFYERREGLDRRAARPDPPPAPLLLRRAKKERRRRVDPTTFEKQYSQDEIEFMTAMQEFKIHSGKPFPTYAEVLQVAHRLGYRRVVDDDSVEEVDESGADTGVDPIEEAPPVSIPFAGVSGHAS